MSDFFRFLNDLPLLISAVGLIGVVVIIFAESSFVFFLPGDSLLFTAGLFASQGKLNIVALSILCFLAAIVGNSIGYLIGKKIGLKLFNKKKSLFFSKENLKTTTDFYKAHGKKTIILARFIPVVRTFAPIVAGVSRMNYKTFVTYNIIGGFLWTIGLTLGGFILGNTIPDVDKYLLPIIVAIIIISILPGVYHVLKEESSRVKLFALAKRILKIHFRK